jgi:hypothetical protein
VEFDTTCHLDLSSFETCRDQHHFFSVYYILCGQKAGEHVSDGGYFDFEGVIEAMTRSGEDYPHRGREGAASPLGTRMLCKETKKAKGG